MSLPHATELDWTLATTYAAALIPANASGWQASAMARDLTDELTALIVLAAALQVAELDRFMRQARAAGAFHEDAQTVEVASETRQGVVYEVALDGSRCTCPGFVFRGRCKHVTARVAA